MKSKLEVLLEKQAEIFEKEANLALSGFNKGFFEGKAEQARLTITALRVSFTGEPQDILDALNGDA